MSMTLATTWVRRGAAAEIPKKYEVDEVELSRIERLARLQLQEAQEDLNTAQDLPSGADNSSEDEPETKQPNPRNGQPQIQNQGDEDDLKEYHLSDYDDDEVDEDGEKLAMFGNVHSLAYYAPGEEDAYLTLPEGDQDSDNEREELQILPTDNLLLAAKVEDEVAHLEIFVYDDESDSLYVHHDIMLPAIPLCVEWINFPVGKGVGNSVSGNYAAIGTMSSEIEVWDLDVVDSMYPSAILGQSPETVAPERLETKDSRRKKSKKTKKPKANNEFHVDAVLALAANKHHRNLLASASADETVKLWDLSTGKCAKSYSMHSGKVCALDWHPTDTTVLLSGSYDRTIVVTDMRAPDAVGSKWLVEADVENVRWDPHNSHFFYVTTEAGAVHYFDARTPPSSHVEPSKPVWTLQAHDGAVSAFDINTTIPGYFVTGSDDKKVKLWNVQDNKPGMVVSRNLEVGRVFATKFAPDSEVAFRLCVAGSKGQVQIWDTSTNAGIRTVFAGKTNLPEGDVKERFVVQNNDDDEDDSEEDEENDNEEGGAMTGEAQRDGWESMDED